MVRHPYIGCYESTIHTQSQHFHKPLAGLCSQVDMGQLQALFSEQPSEIGHETCGMIDQTSTRRKNCGV